VMSQEQIFFKKSKKPMRFKEICDLHKNKNPEFILLPARENYN
jgi:hypothetical protein